MTEDPLSDFKIEIPLNETMLKKGLFDAPLRLRQALAAFGVHEYSKQVIGTVVAISVTLRINGQINQEEARFSRPKTHGGSYSRLWITGLRREAQVGDVLSIEIDTDASMSAVISRAAREPARPRRGVVIGPDVTAKDFSGYGGGRKLVELLRDHVVIVMGGMVECQPGNFMGASVAEINEAADLGLDALDESRAVVKAVLASLVRSGFVEPKKHGHRYYYTLVKVK